MNQPTLPSDAPRDQLIPVSIDDEMRTSFIDYAMSIIVSRALPDVRDGLKPVHRRILYAMSEIGLEPNKPHRKCARIVGEVLGKFHPHGDSAVYEALVRLAQPFSSRYPLVDGHGNFGTLDDNPAAMRYTEARLSKVSAEMLEDLDSETVSFQDNFDASLQEPTVLPAKLPLLLLNGSSGIAVGMATNIPPHNLGEVTAGIIHLIDHPDSTVQDLMQFIKGPDFPSGGVILGTQGIVDAYTTGRGSVPVRAIVEIEEIGGRSSKAQAIVVKELPYLVGSEALINKIAELVKTEKLAGIADLNDESGRQGMRVVIKLKRDANPDVVLNNLYKFTQLQQNFAVNTLALVNGRPKLLSLKEMLQCFIEHRVEVITKKAQYDLRKASERLHIVEGLLKAISSLDDVIQMIRDSEDVEKARTALVTGYQLTEIQANAILEMQLRRITGLEREKLEQENAALLSRIADLQALLADRMLVLSSIKEDLTQLRQKYSDSRKTVIESAAGSLSDIDLIPNDPMFVLLTSQNYIKRLPTGSFESQNRAGRGRGGLTVRDDDDLQDCASANMHDQVLFFTNRGVVYSERVYRIPEGSRQTKGKPLVNIIPVQPEEQCTAIIPFSGDLLATESSLIMLTRGGIVKKIELAAFAHIRRSGIIAINLNQGDELGWVLHCKPGHHLVLATHQGMVIRYAESELRVLGRNAAGVKAINLRDGDRLVSCGAFDPTKEDKIFLLLVTDDGYGKRVLAMEFRDQKRGGTGLIGTKFKRTSSKLAGLAVVTSEKDVMIATAGGVFLRQKAGEIPTQSRMATGVKLQQIAEDDRVVAVTSVCCNVDPCE